MRTPLALAATAAAAAALLPSPSYAMDPVADCATFLANAAAGTSASCATQGLPPLGSNTFGAYRTVYVAVASGSVRATLACDTPGLGGTTTVTSTARLGGWGGGYCTVTLVALAGGTSAAATSLGTYAGTF
jgi:hypothetical protein